MKSLDCFFSAKKLIDQVFKFPSQMTAIVSDKEVVWQNSIPGKTTGPIGRCLCYKRFVLTLELIILCVGLLATIIIAITIFAYLLGSEFA